MVGSSRICVSVIVVETSELVVLMRGTSATTLMFSFVPATSILRSTLAAPPTETVTFAFAALKPASSVRQLVLRRGQVREHVLARRVSDDGARGTGADRFRVHGDTRQDAARSRR